MSEEIEFKKKVCEVYDAAVRLWSASGVERHGEGHPGVPGPGGLEKADWNADRALLDGAINTLSAIQARKFSESPQVLLVCTVVSGEDFAQPFHLMTTNNAAGVQLLKETVASVWCGERWSELSSSCRSAESFLEGEGLLAMFEFYFRHHWVESYYISTFEPGQITSVEFQRQQRENS